MRLSVFCSLRYNRPHFCDRNVSQRLTTERSLLQNSFGRQETVQTACPDCHKRQSLLSSDPTRHYPDLTNEEAIRKECDSEGQPRWMVEKGLGCVSDSTALSRPTSFSETSLMYIRPTFTFRLGVFKTTRPHLLWSVQGASVLSSLNQAVNPGSCQWENKLNQICCSRLFFLWLASVQVSSWG